MRQLIESISALYKEWRGIDPVSVDLLPQSGSERRYFRLYGENETVIGTHGANIPENETFIYFSRQFREKGLPVPEIFGITTVSVPFFIGIA